MQRRFSPAQLGPILGVSESTIKRWVGAGRSAGVGGQGLTPKLQDQLVATAFGTRLAHLKAFAAGMTRKRT